MAEERHLEPGAARAQHGDGKRGEPSRSSGGAAGASSAGVASWSDDVIEPMPAAVRRSP